MEPIHPHNLKKHFPPGQTVFTARGTTGLVAEYQVTQTLEARYLSVIYGEKDTWRSHRVEDPVILKHGDQAILQSKARSGFEGHLMLMPLVFLYNRTTDVIEKISSAHLAL